MTERIRIRIEPDERKRNPGTVHPQLAAGQSAIGPDGVDEHVIEVSGWVAVASNGDRLLEVRMVPGEHAFEAANRFHGMPDRRQWLEAVGKREETER